MAPHDEASGIRQAVARGLMAMVPHYIDVVGRVALTPEQKARAAAARQKVKEEVGPAAYRTPRGGRYRSPGRCCSPRARPI